MRRVLIIGGGCSGALLAIHLLRRSEGLAITVIERSAHLGRGIAYGTQSEHLLLNVPASRMGAFSDNPRDFYEWAVSRHPEVHENSFLPRRWYGEYLTELLQQTRSRSPHHTVEHLQDDAVSAWRTSSGFSVRTAGGNELQCDILALATGNQLPATLPRLLPSSQRVIQNPWDEGFLATALHSQHIAILGSSLTAVDCVVELESSNFKGSFTLISRHGLLPNLHRVGEKPDTEYPTATLVGLPLRLALRSFRNAVDQHPTNWRCAIDALRPYSHKLWCGLSRADQRRFIRFVRPYWDCSRHRVAPEIGERIENLSKIGRLTIVAGHLTAVVEDEQKLRITFDKRRGNEVITVSADQLINCTGPASPAQKPTPLIDSLHRAGLLSYDRLHLGIHTSHQGAVYSATGEVQEDLFALGPLCRGTLWEITAVAEIRAQTEALARTIAP